MSTTIQAGWRIPVSGWWRRRGAERARRASAATRWRCAPRATSDRPELAEEVKALLPDELIDELLAGARTEEEIAGPGGLAGPADEAAGGAGDGGRADRPSRL